MPWKEMSAMDQRLEFVRMAVEGVNRRALFRRCGISAQGGASGLEPSTMAPG